MYTPPVSGTASSDTSEQRQTRPNAAEQADSRAGFALEYQEILDLANDQDSEGESPNWFANELAGITAGQTAFPGAVGETVQNVSFGTPTIPMEAGASGRGSADKGRDTEATLGSLGGPVYSSSMARFLSRNSAAQICVDPEGNVTTPQLSEGGLNKSELVSWMDAHALSQSSHHCAMYCRMGMEAAGISTRDRPRSGDAGDYGPFLLRHGAQVVPAESYTPQVGDTVVFDKTEQHPYGHIEIFDGHQWVSDFRQHSFSPYHDASSTPPFTIYRLA